MWLLCAHPAEDKNLKRVNRNQMAYPKGTNPGQIIYKKKNSEGTFLL